MTSDRDFEEFYLVYLGGLRERAIYVVKRRYVFVTGGGVEGNRTEVGGSRWGKGKMG